MFLWTSFHAFCQLLCLKCTKDLQDKISVSDVYVYRAQHELLYQAYACVSLGNALRRIAKDTCLAHWSVILYFLPLVTLVDSCHTCWFPLLGKMSLLHSCLVQLTIRPCQEINQRLFNSWDGCVCLRLYSLDGDKTYPLPFGSHLRLVDGVQYLTLHRSLHPPGKHCQGSHSMHSL